MPKTAAEKAIDDALKANNVVGRAAEKYATAQEKLNEASREVTRAKRELNWRLAHPDLPEEFDLDAHLAAQESDDGFPDETPVLQPAFNDGEMVNVADVPSTESDGSVSDTDETIAEPEEKPKPRARAAKAKEAAPEPTPKEGDEPEPDVSDDAPDDDPFGDE